MLVLGGGGYYGMVVDVGCVVGHIRMGIARSFRRLGVLVVGIWTWAIRHDDMIWDEMDLVGGWLMARGRQLLGPMPDSTSTSAVCWLG